MSAITAVSTGQRPSAVLFDLDGTLVDSAPDLVDAINRVRSDHGRPAMPLHDLRPTVSKGGRSMLAAAFPDYSEDQRAPLLAPFLAYYGQASVCRSVVFEGVAEVLAGLEQRGIVWGIVTNKPIALARVVVAGFGWSTRSAVLLGGDSLPRRKPDPDQLLHACAELSIAPEHCLYVGDDHRDVVAAKAAGMKAVVALWGYRGQDEDPREWGGDVMIEAPLVLLDAAVLALP